MPSLGCVKGNKMPDTGRWQWDESISWSCVLPEIFGEPLWDTESPRPVLASLFLCSYVLKLFILEFIYLPQAIVQYIIESGAWYRIRYGATLALESSTTSRVPTRRPKVKEIQLIIHDVCICDTQSGTQYLVIQDVWVCDTHSVTSYDRHSGLGPKNGVRKCF